MINFFGFHEGAILLMIVVLLLALFVLMGWGIYKKNMEEHEFFGYETISVGTEITCMDALLLSVYGLMDYELGYVLEWSKMRERG